MHNVHDVQKYKEQSKILHSLEYLISETNNISLDSSLYLSIEI